MAPRVAFPLANLAASRALRLDKTLAEAHSALAYISVHYDWDWPRAAAGFERAVKLNPNSSHAHHWYAHYLMAMGCIQEALGESLRILELDPLDVIINVHLAWHHYLAHQFPEAADAAKKALEMEPHSHFAHYYLGQAYEQMKMYPQAVEALEKSLALSGGSIAMKSALGHAYGLSGNQGVLVLLWLIATVGGVIGRSSRIPWRARLGRHTLPASSAKAGCTACSTSFAGGAEAL